MIRDSGWDGRVVTAYRPDAVVDPDFEGFAANLDRLGEITGCDTGTWARLSRRAPQAPRLLQGVRRDVDATTAIRPPRPPTFPTRRPRSCSTASGAAPADERERRLFRAQMLTEMAKMSLDDGLVLQIHPGSWRNHSPAMMQKFGRDKGFDIPTRTDYVAALKPLLDCGRHRART